MADGWSGNGGTVQENGTSLQASSRGKVYDSGMDVGRRAKNRWRAAWRELDASDRVNKLRERIKASTKGTSQDSQEA